jgi:stage V sporulation protein D (sporulation-specific penicillin-binding protein)
VDLPGEALGNMIKEEDLKPINIATISIGQAIAVTPIQTNHGCFCVATEMLMEPQIVRPVIDAEGNVVQDFAPKPVRRVISEKNGGD